MRVAVLSGGRSSEHEISLLSGEAVAEGLEAAGHEVIRIQIEKSGLWVSGGQAVEIRPGEGLTVDGDLLSLDVVFPVLHGPFGEDGVTQGALDTVGVPYAGSDVLASAVCMDKLTLKRLCGFHGIPQVGFVQAFTPGWEEEALGLEFPLWVKPSRLGSSVGISKVTDPSGLAAAVEEAARFDPRVIIEANSAGREIECSVLGNENPEASLPGEILTDDEWYDYEAKYTEGRTRIAAPADLDEPTTAAVRDLATRVFTMAGCSGLARCDFFVEEPAAGESGQARILLNEINTIPGFTRTSVYAKLWEATGLPYPDLCNRLAELALDRHKSESDYTF
ncbi:MAG TPA: D-alanine--D-alanine ligase family protein [Solirubrobacterales bacterium]|nr:D-alanine--D-alanine ligase family protein [Solirubrobacterales bacterium]HNE77347.1 D-alanine--D-alanine ligase family protein [Solirubrobacterales bacterium]HNI40822.1 D-alanine--D-alanine ligase family protein [Solirubrobacterales bacterium]